MTPYDLRTQEHARALENMHLAAADAELNKLTDVDQHYVETHIRPLLMRDITVLVCKGGSPSSQKATTAVKEALIKALEALGHTQENIAFLRVGEEAATGTDARQGLMDVTLELLDPEMVVAIDAKAWELLAGLQSTEPVKTELRGRTMVYVGDFEQALGNEREKQRAWAFLKSVRYKKTIY